MAEVVLFEDNVHWAARARDEIRKGGHDLVASAESIYHAFGVLEAMVGRHLKADIVILDGTLIEDPELDSPVFEYTHPGETEMLPQVSGRFFKKTSYIEVPRVTKIEIDPTRQQPHARAIAHVIETTGIAAKIIGYSLDTMAADIPIHYDLEKNPDRLNDTINTLLTP